MCHCPGVLVSDVLEPADVAALVEELDLHQVTLGFLGNGVPVDGYSLKDEGESLLVTSLAELLVHLGLQVVARLRARLERVFKEFALLWRDVPCPLAEPSRLGSQPLQIVENSFWDHPGLLAPELDPHGSGVCLDDQGLMPGGNELLWVLDERGQVLLVAVEN